MDTRQHKEAAVLALKGHTCVYKEKAFIHIVRVTDVAVDSAGANFELQVVPAAGFRAGGPECLKASAAWHVLSISDRSIAGYFIWILVIRPDLVAQIEAFAAEANDPMQLIGYVNSLSFDKADE